MDAEAAQYNLVKQAILRHLNITGGKHREYQRPPDTRPRVVTQRLCDHMVRWLCPAQKLGVQMGEGRLGTVRFILTLDLTMGAFSDSGSKPVALMVAFWILVFFLVITVICVIKYIQIKQGKVRKVSQQEDGDQRADSPTPTGQPTGEEITYTAVSFQKKKQTTRKEKPSVIPEEVITYTTLEFQKRDSPTGDMGTVCNAF
ncbi:uncharacterized protein LOC121313779 [Polyodon spathula]|uniref:uncharacterized protein LOC121313779 n=1 Tax=Polyodon spathula TaxID=7913 RepID=UPI001B7E5E23|nr:uncharacterized protein LOC121313779 [Polyodon spathula]